MTSSSIGGVCAGGAAICCEGLPADLAGVLHAARDRCARMSRISVATMKRRRVESRATLRETKFPDAVAAEEQRLWLQWLELGGAAPTTLSAYSWTTDRLLELFPDTPFTAVSDAELLAVLKTYPPKSRPRSKAVFASWFKWGTRTRRRPDNPVDYLPDFKKHLQPVVPVFTVEEEAALRALPEPDGTLMALLFDTGLRKAEARHLTAQRIDFQNEQIIVIEGAKGGKQRIVPIDQETTPFLLGRLDQMLTLEGIGPKQYLWPTRPGGGRVSHEKPIHPASWHWWWVAGIERAEIRYLKPHTTRHTYATRWREKGLDLADIQMLLGHESILTTQKIYVHQELKDVRRRMAAARSEEES